MSGRFSDVVNWLLALLVVCAVCIVCIGISFFLTLNISVLFLHVGNVWYGYVGSQVMADYRRVLTYLQWWLSLHPDINRFIIIKNGVNTQ